MWLLLACASPEVDSGRPPKDTADTAVDSGDTAVDSGDSGETGETDDSGETGDSPAGPLPLCLNELMPDNEAALVDAAGATPDWLELHNPGEADLDLAGWSLTDDADDPRRSVLGAGMVLPAGGFLVLYADGDTAAGPEHLSFALDANGGEVGLYAPDGRGAVLRYGAVSTDFAIARSPDCCTTEGCLGHDFRGTPGVSNVPLVTTERVLAARAGTWRYADGGVLPGLDWMSPDFDDSAWASGPGPLGYGDAQTTMISYGADPYAKHVTTWFRREIEVTDLDVLGVTVELLRDDGARVFVNGVEAARDNLPAGELSADTLATTAVGDASEVTYYRLAVDPALFVKGRNVVAVEVHQATVDSSDLSFDLGLVVEVVDGG